MSLKINKYQQLEGGPFTKSNNLCNVFVEPQMGTVDMTKSYVELETKFKLNGNYVQEGVLLGSAAVGGVEEVNYTPAALVKNCKLASEKIALIEEHRFINVLNQTLETVEKTEEDHNGNFVYGRADPLLLDSNAVANLQIPLSDILGCGKLSDFPIEKTGKLQLQLEFENKLDVAFQQEIGVPLRTCPCAQVVNGSGVALPVTSLTTVSYFVNGGSDLTDYFFPVGTTCTVTFVRTDQAPTVTTVQRVVASASLNADNTVTVQFTSPLTTLPIGVNMFNVVITTNGIDGISCNNLAAGDDRDVVEQTSGTGGFNVGDEVDIGYGISNGVGFDFEILATRIVAVNGGDEYTIADPLPAGEIENICIREHNWQVVDYEIQKVNLVLFSMPNAKVSGSTMYTTYHLEMTNMLETVDFRQQYDVEENCLRAILLSPVETLVSTHDGATAWRVSIDNVDTTNRDVQLNYVSDNTLYYDRLIQNMENVQSLLLRNSNLEVFLIPQKMPTDGRRHVLNVRLYSNDNMSAKVIYVFKQIVMELA
jgi:hypothetical protein